MEETQETAPYSDNLLDDVEYVLHQASPGKRFANYLIDRVIFYLLWQFLLARFVVEMIFFLKVPLDDRWAVFFFSYGLAATSFIIFVAALESLTGGKTIGKYVTGTRAVNDDGTRISPNTAFMRSLCRLIPFEPFSALGGDPSYPWHDRWTKTLVVVENLSTLPPEE